MIDPGYWTEPKTLSGNRSRSTSRKNLIQLPFPSGVKFIKDIVAFGNSGGGAVVFGVNKDGTNSKC